MKQNTLSDFFPGWPYQATERRPDGDINNGAFNLISNPEKIDLIHEATEANGLRPLLVYLNRPNGDFMTLGTASGSSEDSPYHSYLQFTIRYYEIAIDKEWPQDFEKKWNQWLGKLGTSKPELSQAINRSVVLEWDYFYLRPETEQRLLVSMFPRSTTEASHKELYSYILQFFQALEDGDLN